MCPASPDRHPTRPEPRRARCGHAHGICRVARPTFAAPRLFTGVEVDGTVVVQDVHDARVIGLVRLDRDEEATATDAFR